MKCSGVYCRTSREGMLSHKLKLHCCIFFHPFLLEPLMTSSYLQQHETNKIEIHPHLTES